MIFDLEEVMIESKIKYPLLKRGKVRDLYEVNDKLLIISTDRISAFDVILPNGIPHKGKALNLLSVHWFEETEDLVPNHLLEVVDSRSILVERTNPIKVEFVVRGYLYGSAWKKYEDGKKISGIKLPNGLKMAEKLPQPILTPTTKSNFGHDIELKMTDVTKLIGKETAKKIENLSMKIYHIASEYAESKGIIIADTKFEFGIWHGEVLLIDEVLTPDSSRFWLMDQYVIGKNQLSFDKQYVRDYLDSLDWNKQPPAPNLPEYVIVETSKKYLEAYERITGNSLR